MKKLEQSTLKYAKHASVRISLISFTGLSLLSTSQSFSTSLRAADHHGFPQAPCGHVVRLTREKVPLRRSQDLQTTDDSTKPRRRDGQLACLASSTSEGWLSPTTIGLCVAWVPHSKRYFFCNSLVAFRGSTILRICTSVSTPPSNEELLEFQSGRNLFGLG